jgi:sialate O-acetylesterase
VLFEDVLVGELWLCAGQSNMAMPLSACQGGASAARQHLPSLRLRSLSTSAGDGSLGDLAPADAGWRPAGPESSPRFSGTCFFFGRALHQALGVPVGLIAAAVPGSSMNQWAAPGAEHFDAYIAPLQPLALRGVAWYQGAVDAPQHARFGDRLKALISSWRQGWDKAELPFLVVQLPPYDHGVGLFYPRVWEAQERALELPATAVVSGLGIGGAGVVHPPNKAPLGERLARAARHLAYGERLVWSGPRLRAQRREGRTLVLSFDHVGGGLVASGGVLKGFSVAGEDGRFHPARARIAGEEVFLQSDEVRRPVAVRYGWYQINAEPEANLYNREGLPAPGFSAELR